MNKARQAGRDVNRTELAEFMGVSLPTVDDWVRKGCPVVEKGGRGRPWTFNTDAVRRWREDLRVEEATGEQKGIVASLELRRMTAGVEREELALARDKGLVAPVDDFERAMTSAFARVRAKMRMIPNRAARQIVGMTDETAIRDILAKEIDAALALLATEPLAEDDVLFALVEAKA